MKQFFKFIERQEPERAVKYYEVMQDKGRFFKTHEELKRINSKEKNIRNRNKYGNTRWRNLRKQVIEEHPYCSNPWCKSDQDLTVDHIKPLAEGGTNNIGNLRVLCIDCHRKEDEKWSEYYGKIGTENDPLSYI